MDTTLLQQLAKHLNLTDIYDEPEPYVLTPEDEEKVIDNEVFAFKKYTVWKLANMGFGEAEIEFKISQMDFKGSLDREAILQRANMCKNQDNWQKQKRLEDKELYVKKLQELAKVWTAKFVYGFMAWTSENTFGKELIVNENNKKLISVLCFFVSRDKRFSDQLGYNFNKGLLIRGKCGIGKTHLVKCIEKNEVRPILTMSMIDITDEVRAHGEFEIEMRDNKILYLDDMGTEEPTIKFYGSNISWFKEFIETVYLKSKGFSHLIISTNINFKGIEDKYGFRVASRMRDMFNIIDVDGEDMRNG